MEFFELLKQQNANSTSIIHNDLSYNFLDLIKRIHEISENISSSLKSISQNRSQIIIAIILPVGIDLIASIFASFHLALIFTIIPIEYPTSYIRECIRGLSVTLIIHWNSISNSLIYEPFTSSSTLSSHSFLANCSCIYYTSGSTSDPKAILLPTQGIINRCHWYWKSFPFEHNERTILSSSVEFIDALYEILTSLCCGVPLLLIDELKRRDPYFMNSLLITHFITRITLVPTLLAALIPIWKENKPLLLMIISSGEPLLKSIAYSLMNLFPNLRLLNLYGCTESCGDSTCFEMKYSTFENVSVYLEESHYVPIGYPLDGYNILIDDNGEILIGGNSLIAKGYLNENISTNNEKFIVLNESLFFRTEDLGFIRNGILYYHSRMSNCCIKVRGIRVDLAALENRILNSPFGVHFDKSKSPHTINSFFNESLFISFVHISYIEILNDTLLIANIKLNKRDSHYITSYLAFSLHSYLRKALPSSYLISRILIWEIDFPFIRHSKIDVVSCREYCKRAYLCFQSLVTIISNAEEVFLYNEIGKMKKGENLALNEKDSSLELLLKEDEDCFQKYRDYEPSSLFQISNNRKYDASFSFLLNEIRRGFSITLNLSLNDITSSSDFWELGGTSLSAISLLSYLNNAITSFHITPSFYAIKHFSTVSSLASFLLSRLEIHYEVSTYSSLSSNYFTHYSQFGTSILSEHIDDVIIEGVAISRSSKYTTFSFCSSLQKYFVSKEMISSSYYDYERIPVNNNLKEESLPIVNLLWHYNTNECIDGSPLICIFPYENKSFGFIFIGSHSGMVVCLNINGQVIWRIFLPNRIESSISISSDFLFLYVGSYDGNLYIINSYNGNILSTFTTSGEIKSSALVIDNHIWFGSYDSHIYCIEHIFPNRPHFIASFECEAPIYSTPVKDRNINVIFCNIMGEIFCICNSEKPFILWKRNFLNSPIFATPCVTLNSLIFGDASGTLLKVSLSSNSNITVIWKWKAPSMLFSSPVEFQKWIFIGCHNGSLYCINIETGICEWEYHFDSSPIASSPFISFRKSKDRDDILLFWATVSGYLFVMKLLISRIEQDFSYLIIHNDQNQDLPFPVAVNFHKLTNAHIYSSPVFDGRKMLFIGSRDNHLYGIGINI